MFLKSVSNYAVKLRNFSDIRGIYPPPKSQILTLPARFPRPRLPCRRAQLHRPNITRDKTDKTPSAEPISRCLGGYIFLCRGMCGGRLLDAARGQFAFQKTVNVARALMVEAGGIALQPLVGVGVDHCGESLLHRELWVIVHQQQGKVLHHVEFHQFLRAHSLFRILMARSVPK